MPKKNGFFYFMLDYKKREEGKGRKFRGLDQVAPIAGDIWAKMNAKQREPYNLQAKQDVTSPNSGKGKISNLGIPITEIEQDRRTKEDKVQRQKTLISTLVKNAASKNVLEKQEFYFISMAYFCRTIDGVYLPAELAVVRYSLEGGVKDRLHMFINPGRLPIGMAYEAQQHAEEDHQLPIPPNAMGETDFGDVAMKLFTFLLQDDELPLLFTDQKDVLVVENMLELILREHLDEMELNVCPLAELFFRLKQSVEQYMMDQTTFPSVHIAQQIITKDVYDYTKGISCEYHEEKDHVLYCPLSRCTRWAYVISDNCCQDMGIEPIPGKHVPMNANTNPTACTYDLTSHDDTDSFVSGSNVSRITSAIVMSDTYASSQPPIGRRGIRNGPQACSSEIRSQTSRIEETLNASSSSSNQHETDDDKTELQASIKRTAAWDSNSVPSGSGWSSEAKTVANSIRGAGRGRGQILDEFPPLAGVGGRGRARRFL
uniref:Maelstrom domain-containing protein n=1 Tax=Anopheles christyi TaxID=43041 RepID=A0A182KB73_9DIPT